MAASGAGNNPVYQSMQLELNKVGVEIAALRRELEQHQTTVADLRQRLNTAPQVEAEFQQLNRDYDVNKAQYTALLESYQKARLGERADTAGSVRFEVVLPPTAPISPVWPKRTLLLGVIWIAALAVGAAIAYGLNILKPIVISMSAMNELTSFPVLGVAGSAFPSRQRANARRHIWHISVAAALLVSCICIGADIELVRSEAFPACNPFLGDDVSLVEQTIARLKKEQAQVSSTFRPAGQRQRRVPSRDLEAPGRAGKPANKISIDSAALRAAGYLPETEKDRQFADQYRRIKRPLIDKALSGESEVGDPRIMMVTSALPGDGKTFTGINLALSLSLERDMSVLLIDADVAKRHVSQIFGLDSKPGLLDVLVDERLDAASVIIPTTTPGLSILPAGGRVANTAELLSSTRMGKVMAGFCARNPRRILLLDSPPLLVTNEGRALVKLVGQVVLVVRVGQTPRQAVRAAIDLFDLRQAGGVVLNQVPGASTGEYYGYGSYGNDGAQT